jgi:hypothetical protein
MGDAETIVKIINKARHELQKAQDAADNTPRPPNACAAHDSQFALTRALTGAMDTLLMIAEQDIDGVSSDAPEGRMGVFLALLNRPWPWAFASIAVFSPNIVYILTFFTGK